MTRGDRLSRTDEEIERYGLLDTAPGRELQALVQLAALIAGVPRAAINIVTSTHQHQVATTGVAPSVCLRADSMCAAVVDEPQVVLVPDAGEDPRFRGNPFVTGEIACTRFYASAPLVTRAGIVLGRLCVFDEEPRHLDEEQQQALMVVAERVVDVLELRLRSQELERSLVELTRTRDELHRSNERLSTFAGQVSHDLRTPLTAMLLNVESASHDPGVQQHAPVQQALEAAMDAGHRMTRFIDDLLDFARMGAQLRAEAVDLDGLVREVVSDLRPAIDGSGAAVEVVGSLGTVVGDRHQLYSVFLNLLSNALKFTRAGVAPRVSVQAVGDAAELTVEVTDNGRGIAAEQQAHVFDLFTRAERSVAGSGIGLATVRAAVEAHGGTVGVRSPGTAGATFWFTLPRRGEDAGAEPTGRS